MCNIHLMIGSSGLQFIWIHSDPQYNQRCEGWYALHCFSWWILMTLVQCKQLYFQILWLVSLQGWSQLYVKFLLARFRVILLLERPHKLRAVLHIQWCHFKYPCGSVIQDLCVAKVAYEMLKDLPMPRGWFLTMTNKGANCKWDVWLGVRGKVH